MTQPANKRLLTEAAGTTLVTQAVTAAVAGLVNGAPGALDTLLELANQLAADETGAAALATVVASKETPAGAQTKATAAQSAAIAAAAADATSKVAAEAAARTTAINAAIAALVNGAPGALDTLLELATQLAADESAATALTTAVGLREISVSHGATAGTARPTSSLPVQWSGTVAPTNAATNDKWWDETNELMQRKSASGWVASGSKSYATLRASARFDPASKSNGAIGTAMDTGQAVTTFASPTSPSPLSISGGLIVHTPYAGLQSAGYMQVNLGARVHRLGCMVQWPTSALGVLGLVIPSAAWSSGVLPNAGFHFVLNGNGIWALTRFTTVSADDTSPLTRRTVGPQRCGQGPRSDRRLSRLRQQRRRDPVA